MKELVLHATARITRYGFKKIYRLRRILRAFTKTAKTNQCFHIPNNSKSFDLGSSPVKSTTNQKSSPVNQELPHPVNIPTTDNSSSSRTNLNLSIIHPLRVWPSAQLLRYSITYFSQKYYFAYRNRTYTLAGDSIAKAINWMRCRVIRLEYSIHPSQPQTVTSYGCNWWQHPG